jgi:two-component system nitrate/nitrite response regulator NarL
MKTVALAPSSPLLKSAIAQLLTKAGWSVAEISDFAGGSSRVAAGADVLIVDAGLWVAEYGLQRIQEAGPDRMIVLGSAEELRRFTPDQIMAADGILDVTAETLYQTLILVQAGERVLSTREGEVVRHLAQGSRNKIIARELGITEATVKVHLKSLYRKLRVSNRTQAAVRYHCFRHQAEIAALARRDATSASYHDEPRFARPPSNPMQQNF